MKKSKTEKAIIDLIEMRQMELRTEAMQFAIETFESPPRTARQAWKVAGLSMGYMIRISQLQRAKRIIEPKPEMAKGGIISKGEEEVITDKGDEVIQRIPYIPPAQRNPVSEEMRRDMDRLADTIKQKRTKKWPQQNKT